MRLIPILVLLSTGCLAGQLRTPAEDHHVQTQHIARACEAGIYGPCSPELIEDLVAMAEQACLIAAIASKAGPEGCKPKGEAK